MQNKRLCLRLWEAMHLIFLLPILAICVQGYLKGDWNQPEECAVWQTVLDSLMQEDNMKVSCEKNPECTGLECNGQYQHSGPWTNRQLFSEDFCFGMVLEPCTNPTVLQVFIEMLDLPNNKSSTTMKNITADTDLQLQGADYDLMLASEGSAFMAIKMNHTEVHGKPHVFISVRLKIRIRTAIGLEIWPEALQVTVVPGMYIPVPPCDPSVGNHTHINGTCHWSQPSMHPTISPPISGGGQLSGHCNPEEMGQCLDHAWCAPAGQCHCLPGYQVQSTSTGQKCTSNNIPNADYPPPVKHPAAQHDEIIGACVGSVLLVILLVVGVLLVIRYRRRQQRYAQHDILMNNEEDDDPLQEAT